MPHFLRFLGHKGLRIEKRVSGAGGQYLFSVPSKPRGEEKVMKKVTALTLMMVALMFTSTAQAAYTVNPFVVCDAGGVQMYPDIDGDIVVWQSSDTNIYWMQFGYSINVINSGGTQTSPAISGDVVVWYDNHANGPTTERDIYGRNLQEGSDLFVTSNDGYKQWYPDIGGDTVVWEDFRSGADIYLYDISTDTEEIICDDAAGQYRPAIDANTVVWMDARHGNYQIYMADISGEPSYTDQRVGNSTGAQWDPAVSGTVVVWREDPSDGSGLNIYGYDLGDPGTGRFPICTASGNQQFPAISGDIVVWQDDSDSEIWAIDLADVGSDRFKVSDGTGTNESPAVSGKTIVWQQNGDIWAAELLEFSSVTVTDPNGGESYLAASPMTIEWTTEGPVDEVLIEFSSNGGANWIPVNTVVNTGSYLWDPIADVDSENCLIRVTNTNDVTAIDQSNATFVIYQIPDLITVTDPNGGEQFLAGSEMDISWTSVGDVNDVKIMFSDNDGDVWQDVVLSTPNNGEFIWDANDVPADANSTHCIIHISDVADSSTWDVSDDPFTVFQCDVELTADLTGDCFVDIADFAEFAYQWLLCGNPYDPAWCGQ